MLYDVHQTTQLFKKNDLFSENGRWLFKSISTYMYMAGVNHVKIFYCNGRSASTSCKSDSFRMFNVAGRVSKAKRSVK